MDVRRGAVALLLLVAVTVASYAVYPNGQFSRGGVLPGWAIATSVAVAVAVAAGVACWLWRTVGWSTSPVPRGTADTVVAMLVVYGVCHVVGVGAEILLRAPALWLVLPVATVGYGAFVVWFQKRHGSSP